MLVIGILRITISLTRPICALPSVHPVQALHAAAACPTSAACITVTRPTPWSARATGTNASCIATMHTAAARPAGAAGTTCSRTAATSSAHIARFRTPMASHSMVGIGILRIAVSLLCPIYTLPSANPVRARWNTATPDASAWTAVPTSAFWAAMAGSRPAGTAGTINRRAAATNNAHVA